MKALQSSNEKILAEPVFIPITTKNEVISNENGVIETDLGEVSFIPANKFTPEEVELYISRLKGIIKIQNYKPAI